MRHPLTAVERVPVTAGSLPADAGADTVIRSGGRARSTRGGRVLRLATWLYDRPPFGRARVTRVELAILVRLATRHPWPACWWLAGALTRPPGGIVLVTGGGTWS